VVPVKDAAGAVIGERMDNLVHGSANAADAEREVKLWFKPCDIMPYMRAYPNRTVRGTLLPDRRPPDHDPPKDQRHRVGRGRRRWKSGPRRPSRHRRGQALGCSLDAVVAKYLINRGE